MLLIATTGDDGLQELPRLDPTAPAVACGSTDEGWRVDRVSPEIERLLGLGSGLRSSSLPGRVHPDDLGRVSEALALTLADRAPVGVSVHMQQADGAWQPVRLVVTADESQAQPRMGFALTDGGSTHAGGDAASEASRAEILERTLQRITNEIQALGFAPSMAGLPTAEELPELADLSAAMGDRDPVATRRAGSRHRRRCSSPEHDPESPVGGVPQARGPLATGTHREAQSTKRQFVQRFVMVRP